MKTGTFLLSIVLLALSSVCSQAQVSFRYEYVGSSSYWLDRGEASRERIGNAEGSARVYQGSINIPVSMKVNSNNQPIVWGVGLSGSYASLNNKNFTDDLVIPEMLNIDLGIYHVRPLGEKWSLMASLGVGAYTPFTDLSKLTSKHILGSGSVIFIRRFNENFELGGGVAVNSTFGYPMIFPALYLNWNMQGRIDFMLSMANGLEVSAGLDAGKLFRISLVGEMNGQSALLEKDGKDVMFSHQYIVAGLRPEIKLGEKVSVPVTAGVNIVRPAYFSDRTLKGMFATNQDYYFQISPYLSAGLTISF